MTCPCCLGPKSGRDLVCLGCHLRARRAPNTVRPIDQNRITT